MVARKTLSIFSMIMILVLLLQGGNAQAGSALSPVYLEGTFITTWGDGQSGESQVAYFLASSSAEMIELIVDSSLLSSSGGALKFNRKTVVVQGTWLQEGTVLQVQLIALAEGAPASPEGIYGSQPWVSILCKFADVPAEPKNLGYFQQMYSPSYPGLDHFWRENSYDLANLEGSGAFGWYVLPHNRDYYLPGGNLDWWTAAAECTAAADPYVDFTPYVGINLMFNDLLDCCAWGGGWYACLDDICQTWRMTWEPPWGYENIGVIGHETGHGFGLPHSSGNYGQVYDNKWDVMSDLWSNGDRGAVDPVFGTMGQHTISYHKDILGWIDSDQMLIADIGSTHTIPIEQIALPQTGDYLGARVLINNATDHFYTVETRRFAGYDTWLPGQAVIIHEVVVGRNEPAHVIDIDGDGDTGDEGAMWRVGESFTDIPNGISISVVSALETGFLVSINNRFTPMQSVVIHADEQGYAGESIPFIAAVSPSGATTPITYTWEATEQTPVVHSGGITDLVYFNWTEEGTKAITITASNDGGVVVDTHLIEIVPKIPIVSLAGPILGKVGAPLDFYATVAPEGVALPITYTWQASGQETITQTSGISDTIRYTWDEPGTQVITVTAANAIGSSSDYFSLPILVSPMGVEVEGPLEGSLNESVIFTAEVSPITTTVPITYVWTVDGQWSVTHSSGVTDTLTYSWSQPGAHRLSVVAYNPAGTVENTWSITIFTKIFLPLSMRH